MAVNDFVAVFVYLRRFMARHVILLIVSCNQSVEVSFRSKKKINTEFYLDRTSNTLKVIFML